MYFYEVWPRSNKYHKTEPLTYQHDAVLTIGTMVRIPMGRAGSVTGFVSARVAKPSFECKPIELMYDLPALPPELMKLGVWVMQYYPAGMGLVAQQLLVELPKTSRTVSSSRALIAASALPTAIAHSRSSGRDGTAGLPPLTNAQSQIVQQITKPDTYILHGRTGSGKTRIYIDIAAKSISQGRSVLMLTPEISLTSQLTQRFVQVFGAERVVVMHSGLTQAERRMAWLRLLTSTEPLVVIGPRSVLFSPLKNIGLIILDEAHEPAYKQEQAPHYQAARVAAKLRELHDATLILGSATPALGDYYLAERLHKPILTLSERALPSDHAVSTRVIDLKDRTLFPRSSYLSQPLVAAIKQALDDGEQSLLYLNRRGTARMVVCENCGWQARCLHCDIPLTYHGDTHELKCHVCGFKQSPPVVCPDCGKPEITYKTIGTKAIVDEVQRLFPHARIMRFDTDNTKDERFEHKYDAILRGEVDILIGTQLLAKGLDLPRLSVLGVLVADTSLQMPDFSASERTYQLLTQVLGRIGRGHRGGQAFVQTYQPENPIIKWALDDDYRTFYEQELTERRTFKFPPFYSVLKLTVRRASNRSAEKAASDLAATLAGTELIIEGPAPSLHEKIAGKYQYQVVVKSKSRAALLEVVKKLPSGWSFDIDPADLL